MDNKYYTLIGGFKIVAIIIIGLNIHISKGNEKKLVKILHTLMINIHNPKLMCSNLLF